MAKVYGALAILALLSAIGSSIYYAGYENGLNSRVGDENVVIIDGVKNDNQDKIALQEHTREVNTLKAKLKAANARVPRADPSVECPIDEFERMYNSTSSATGKSATVPE